MNQSKRQQSRACTFEMQVPEGTGKIKFPCFCFVQWKTSNGKDVIKTANRVKLIQGKLAFGQKLLLTTHMVYDLTQQTYNKKQSFVILNLLSNSSPNQPKHVGRITVQLSQVANGSNFQELKQYPLQFCSVDATLTFKVGFKGFVQTNLAPSDLERSQYSEIEPILPEKQTGKQDVKSQSGVRAISSVNVGQSVGSRVYRQNVQKSGQISFQQCMNRLKTENQHLLNAKVPEAYASRLKKEMEGNETQGISNIGNSRYLNSRRYDEQRETKGLNNDFSVPVLTKNSEEFDSCKVSQKTIQNPGKSQRQMSFNDSPAKNSSNLIKESNKSLQQQQFHSIKNQQLLAQSNSSAKYLQQIENLKVFLEGLKTQNSKLTNQLQLKDNQLTLQKNQHQQSKKNINKLSEQLAIKNKELQQMLQHNYPALIEQLNRSIQQKDHQIQSLIASTFETEKQFQDKQLQFQRRMQQLQNYVRSLEESNKQKLSPSPKVQISPQKSQRNSPISISSPQRQKLNSKIQDLNYLLQIERKNHENAKLQLSEVQQWYKELQQQTQRIGEENEGLKKLYDEERQNNQRLQGIIQQLKVQSLEDTTSKLQLQQKDIKIAALTEELNQSKEQLAALNHIIQLHNVNEQKLVNQLTTLKKELDDLQSKYIEQETSLHISENKVKEYSILIDLNKKQAQANSLAIQTKNEQIEDIQKKTNDLIKRMKEKQENTLKIQREAEQLESKLKNIQSNCDKVKQRVKVLQAEKNNDQQKIKSLQKQNRLLKSKTQRDQDQLSKEINKLKLNLQNENHKKKQLSNMLCQAESKSKLSESYKIKELEKKINKYVQKQSLLKEQLILLEQQSNKISETMLEKQQNEERYTQTIVVLNQENVMLKARVSEVQNQIQLLNERNQGLQAQIQLLNAYQPNQAQDNEIAELNKKLIEKNKQLLHQIQEKNLFIAELQKTEGEMKGKQVEQILSASRSQKQKQQYEQKYLQIAEQNQKLYKQFEKLNIKYKEQLLQNNKTNDEKNKSFQSKIQQLYLKLTQKDVKYQELQMKSRDDLEKLQQTLHEKQYQLEYYPNQIRELNNGIQTLNDQVGQKQFQLHLAEQKIRQLYGIISELQVKKDEAPAPVASPPVSVQNNEALQEELNHYKSKTQFYEAEIQRLHEKEFIQDKDLITLNEELTKLKLNSEEQFKHITYLQEQLKNFRQRQTQYIQQIDEFQLNQNQFKGKYSRLEKDKSELKAEIERLNNQIQQLQQKKVEKNQEGTPIDKFKESSSPSRPSVDISDIFGEINIILTRRKQEQQLQNALRLVIDNNTRQEQQFERWSRQRGMIQEKAKLASKQLQKIKSNIMKTAGKSITEKTQLTNLLKPAEAIVNELINISENLIQLDPYEEEQDEQFSNSNQHS